MSKYTRIKNKATYFKALELCRGVYQIGLIEGRESLSGATLTGEAKKYIGRYRTSGMNLLKRCQAHGLHVYEDTGAHNKRIIVFE